MSEQLAAAAQAAAAVEGVDEDEEVLSAPARGSAEELLDAARRRSPRPDAPLSRARHGRGGPGALPRRPGWASGRPSRTASTTTSSCPGRSRPTTSPPSRRAWRLDRGRPSLRARTSSRRTRGGPSSLRAASRTRSRSSTTWRKRRRCGRAAAADGLDVPARALHRPVPRTARGFDGRDRALQAAQRRRRLLARRRAPADAPAHLRHGLGDAGGAGPATSGGASEAKKRDHRRLGVAARPLQLPRRQSGRCLLAPQGPAPVAHARGRHARAPGALRLRRGQHADPGPPRSCGSSRATAPLRATPCSCSRSRDSSSRLKPMNCPESTFIYRSRVRSYRDLPAALRGVRPAAPQRALGRALGPDARAPLHPGRRPHLRAPGPARGRAAAPLRDDQRGVELGGHDAALHVRHQAGQGARRPGPVGAGRGPHRGRRSSGRRGVSRQAQRRHLLRAQDRPLRGRRPRP